MLKSTMGPLALVLGVASCVCSCGSSNNTGAAGGTTGAAGGTTGAAGGTTGAAGGTTGAGGGGGASATGGTNAAGGSAATGGSGGTSAAGGAGGASTLTLADACAKNCTLAAGLAGCSTTMEVCVQSCLTTYDNTSAINPVLGTKYTQMMICIATDPKFASAADFVCAKPNRALNQWSPGPDSNCEPLICDWNCSDGTTGNFDPFIDIRCSCSSV